MGSVVSIMALIAEIVSQNNPVKMKIIGIPDENAINAKPLEIFEYYGLTASNIASQAIQLLRNKAQIVRNLKQKYGIK